MNITYITLGQVQIATIEETKEGCFLLTFMADGSTTYYPSFDAAKAMADKVSYAVAEYINQQNEMKYS